MESTTKSILLVYFASNADALNAYIPQTFIVLPHHRSNSHFNLTCGCCDMTIYKLLVTIGPVQATQEKYRLVPFQRYGGQKVTGSGVTNQNVTEFMEL